MPTPSPSRVLPALTLRGKALLVVGWALCCLTWFAFVVLNFFQLYIGPVILLGALLCVFCLSSLGRLVARRVRSDKGRPDTTPGLAAARFLRPFTASLGVIAGWAVWESLLGIAGIRGVLSTLPQELIAYCSVPLALSAPSVTRSARRGMWLPLNYFLAVCIALLLMLLVDVLRGSLLSVNALVTTYVGVQLVYVSILLFLVAFCYSDESQPLRNQ